MTICFSKVSNCTSAEWTAILTLSNPLLNALSVEDVLLITEQCCDIIIALKLAPTYRTLAPQSSIFSGGSLILLLFLGLLVLEFSLVKR